MTRMDTALQIAIFVLSFAALWLLVEGGALHKWGCLVGFAAQPFWIAATWRAQQWGMLLLAIAYWIPYGRGIWINFF